MDGEGESSGRGQELEFDVSCCSPLIKRAMGFMKENYCAISGVQNIADHLGVKIQTLSSEFSGQCSVSLKGLLVFLKVRHAIFLMSNPGFKMKDIARITGFSDPHHFNVCFKRITGVAPQQFRNENLALDLQKIFHEKVKKTHLP